MVGPSESVIGDDVGEVIKRFLTNMPSRLSVGKGATTFNSVLVDVDTSTGQATSIARIDREAA
jgi:calcineurin-like phosphoesterase